MLAKEDSEQDRRKAVATVEETYQRDQKVVGGSKYLLETLERVTGDYNIAKEILDKLFRIIGKGDLIQQLTRNIMNEYFFATMRDNEEVYYYNGNGLYILDGESLINELCELMCPQIKTHDLNEVVGHIKRWTYVDRSKFDSNIDVLGLRNGLLNIQSKELQPHTPEYLSIVQIPTEYKPGAGCPKILEFFKDVLRPDEVDIMFRVIGYCLHKNCEYEKAAMLYGTGANGKGVVIRIIERFLGEDNCSHRSLQHLDTNRFAVADVCGKLVNTFADLKSVKLSETGNFKMLVSGDSISGEHKFENSFKFRNFAKLIFSANEIPESDDKSDAFYRRWLIFHFDKKFVGGKEDTKLLEKLTKPDELSGLLNLALIGLKQLGDEGGFHEKDIEDIRRDYEEHTNDVNTFLYRECLVDITNSNYSTLATDVYAAYVTFCVKRGSRPKEMSVFGKKLADQGIYNMRHQDHGDRDKYYDGIRLLTDMRELNQTTIG
jgi:putative DNA primase/helicase